MASKPVEERDIDDVKRILRQHQADAQNMIEAFTKEFAKDPMKALSNCDKVFQSVAMRDVAKSLIGAALRGAGVAHLRTFTTKKALERSRTPTHSTSPTYNLVSEYETAAWAEIALLLAPR